MQGKKLKVVTAAAAGALVLTVAVGVVFAENVQAPAQSEPPADHPATSPDTSPPPSVTVLNNHEVQGILGRQVLSSADENMGRIVDVMVDHNGQVRAAIIDFGGFLGVGSRKIAIDWRLVRFVPDDRDAPLVLSLGKAEVQAAPEYKDTAQPPVMVGQPPPDPDAAR